MLERHADAVDLERLGVDERHLGPLRRVLPFLNPSGDAPEPQEHQARERHHVLRALHALLEALASKTPVVLALDDMHWADPESIDLVCRILHRGMVHPSLVLLAMKAGQAETRLRTALWDAERHGVVTWVELQPLSRAESDKLLKGVGDRTLRKLIFRESGGNPLYLEQLAAAGTRHARPAPEDPSGTPVPPALAAAIRAEAQALSAPARTLLEGAAVAGDPFDQALAAEAAGLPAEDALAALDELADSGLIRPSDVSRQFRFRRPIVRHAAYQAAGAGWRLGAHARVAAALAARRNPASARASHVERSAEPGDQAAVAVLTEAGNETLRHAPASAARWFQAASRLIPADETSLEHRLSLAEQRATALGIAGRLDEGLEAANEVLALSPREPTERRLKAAVFAALLNELRGDQHAGRRILLDEIGGLPNPSGPEAADLKRELACTYFFDADWDAMAVSARAALACPCEGMVRVGALAALAIAEYGRHNLDEVGDAVASAGALFDALADQELASHQPASTAWLGWAEVCAERHEDAIRHLARGSRVSRLAGQGHLAAGLRCAHSQALALTGRLETPEVDPEAANEAWLLSASNVLLSWTMTNRCHASLLAGDLREAVRRGERAAAAATAGNPLSGLARVQFAEALLEAGAPERCRAELTDADGRPDLPPYPLYEARSFELLARAALAMSDDAAAERFVERAERSASLITLTLPRAHASRARAALLLHRSDLQAALGAALDSAEAADAINAPVEAARSRILAGRALAAAGRQGDAIKALEAAREQLAACHAFHYAEAAGRELRRLGRAAARRTGDEQHPHGLTDRELEVIKLVSAGHTNREIADELVLSVRTVDRHVARIFHKLGVNSRIAAAGVFERASRPAARRNSA